MSVQVNNSQDKVNNQYAYVSETINQKANFTKALDEKITKIENIVKDNDNYLSSLPPLEYEYRPVTLSGDKTNKEGQNAVLAYAQKANASAATKLYSNLNYSYGFNKSI